MTAVVMVMAAVLFVCTVVMMDLLAIVVCKHAEQLHSVVIGAFVDLESRECRQIDRQQQSYRDIACKLFHLNIILSR